MLLARSVLVQEHRIASSVNQERMSTRASQAHAIHATLERTRVDARVRFATAVLLESTPAA